MIVASQGFSYGQTDSTTTAKNSLNLVLLENYNKRLRDIERQRINDSIKKEELQQEISALKTTTFAKPIDKEAFIPVCTKIFKMCLEKRGIEIMAPHYLVQKDGN